MNFGIDFDGVITDAEELKLRWVRENLGINVAPEQLVHKKTSVIGVEAYQRMVADIYGGEMALQNRVRPEAVSVLKELVDSGDSVHIITARLNSEAVKARQLMAMHQVPHHSFHNTEETPKDQICRQLAIDVFLDDAQSNLLALAGIPGIKLVFFNVYQEQPKPGIVSVVSWHEFAEFVSSLRVGSSK